MRKLTAILFTDIVGFTSLMGESEDLALAAVSRCKEVIQPLVDKYFGTWHKDLGDGALMSFESSSSALQCALEIQESLKGEEGFKLRIGIHQSDVLHENGDVIGDGVNIASRIQSLAEPGGICISEPVLNSNRNKSGIAVKRLRVQQLKNVSIPLNLFHVFKDETATGIILNEKSHRKKRALWIATSAVIITALSLGSYFYFSSSLGSFTDYEKAYFEQDFDKAMELAKEARSPKDVKANYYYILSAANSIPASVSIEKNSPARQLLAHYQDQYRSDPNSYETQFSLSVAYLWFGRFITPSQRDSIPLLLNLSLKGGLTGVCAGLFQVRYFHGFRDKNKLKSLVDTYLINSNNPEALAWAGYTYLADLHDTLTGLKFTKKGLKIYPRYIEGWTDLADYYSSKGDLDSAELMLNKAYLIQPESPGIIDKLRTNYRQQGRFDQGKELLLNAINGFGKDNRLFYYQLAQFYLDEDNVEEGRKITAEALAKFPKDFQLMNLQSSFTSRENWLAQEAKLEKEKKLIPWLTDFDDALNKSKAEGKPVLVDFWTTWCYWCKVLDKKVYPDSLVQEKLKDFVLLKINAEQEFALRTRFDVRAYPTLLLLNENGEEIHKLEDNMQPTAFLKSLDTGWKEFSSRKSGTVLSESSFTKVSNSIDAQIIAKNRNIPIMTVVGDQRSESTRKLIDKTLNDPQFKSSSTDIVFLYLDQNMDDPFLKELPIKTFPSLYFTDSEGNLIYQRRGYQPAHVLSKLVEQVKISHSTGVKIATDINWFYDLDEAQMNAQSESKYLFIAAHDPSCDPCNQMNEGTYNDPEVIAYLNTRFINVYLDDDHDRKQIQSLDIYGFPSQMVMVNGETLFRGWDYKNPDELVNWLDMDLKLRIASVIGFDKFKNYFDKLTYAKALSERGNFRTSNQIIVELSEQVQELPEPYFISGKNYFYLNNYQSGIAQYKKAVTLGMLDKNVLKPLMFSHFAEGIPEDYLSWLDGMLSVYEGDSKSQSLLYWIKSQTYEFLEDTESALSAAQKAIQLHSSSYDAHLQLGKLLFKTGNLANANAILKKAETLDQSDPLATFYLGIMASELGNEKLKGDYFEKVFERSRNVASEVSHRDLENFAGLEKYQAITEMIKQGYHHMIELNPAIITPYIMLSIYDLIEDNVSERTLNYIHSATELRPQNNHYKYFEAWILFELGQKEQSIALLEEAASLTTEGEIENAIHLLYIHGLIYYKSNEVEKAREYLTKVVNFREPQGIDRRLQKLAQELVSVGSEVESEDD